MSFVQCKENKFVVNGKEIVFKGLGVGTWLNLEHFMFGLPGSDEVIRKTINGIYGEETNVLDVYMESFFTEMDAKYLKSIEVNLIRVPVNHRMLRNDNGMKMQGRDGYHYIDELIRVCKKYGIYIMLDMHTSPGGQNPDWHSDNSLGAPSFWKYETHRNALIDIWCEVVERYKEETIIMGFDLLNEPAMAESGILNSFYNKLIKKIREIDQNHILVIEGDQFSMDFSKIELEDSKNVAAGFHYYPTVWHPNLLNDDIDVDERVRQIEDGLLKILEAQNNLQIPFICGEFGYGKDCGDLEKRMQLTIETANLFNKLSIGWCLWDYKDANFMSLVAPAENSGWMRIYNKIEKLWSQEIEKFQAETLIDELQKFYPNLTSEEKYKLQFKLRANMYEIQATYVTKSVLKDVKKEEIEKHLSEFLFDKCKINKEFERVLLYLI